MARRNRAVTVILSVFNGERYLREALDSLGAQTCLAAEIIVIDDGSTDGTAEILRSRKDLRSFRQENQGLSAGRNRGVLEASEGKHLAFIDADDLWTPRKLEWQVAFLDENPTVDMVFGKVEQFVSPELPEELRRSLRCPEEVLPGRLAGCMLLRRDAFERVGPFDVSLRVGEFVDWYMRARDAGLKEHVLDRKLLRRRIHGKNMTLTQKADQQDYLRILKAGLDRRRRMKRNDA